MLHQSSPILPRGVQVRHIYALASKPRPRMIQDRNVKKASRGAGSASGSAWLWEHDGPEALDENWVHEMHRLHNAEQG